MGGVIPPCFFRMRGMGMNQFEQTFGPATFQRVCTLATTAYQLYAGSDKNLRLVQTAVIQAHPSNSGSVFIGDASVDTTAFVLEAGSAMNIGWMIDMRASAVIDLSKFYIYAASAGDKINVITAVRLRGTP